MQEKRTKVFELIVAVFFMLFSSYMLYVAFTSKANMGAYAAKEMHPFTFPKIILFLMLFFAIICFSYTLSWLIKNKKKEQDTQITSFKEKLFFYLPQKSLMTYIFILVYIALWNVLGFALSTIAYISIQTKYLERERSMKQIILIATIVALGLTVLFSVLFRVNLPEPIIDLIF